MRVQAGKVVVEEFENRRIEEITGERVPETGVHPMELRKLITEGLTKVRAERPADKHLWSCLEHLLLEMGLDHLGEPKVLEEQDNSVHDELRELLRQFESRAPAIQ